MTFRWPRSRSTRIGAVALAAIVCGIVVLGRHGARFATNFSESMPVGIYALGPPPRVPVRGTLVTFCLSGRAARLAAARRYLAAGPCADGEAPVIKVVAAVAGDRVRCDGRGVAVDDVLLANSRPLARDTRGRPMPACAFRSRLPPGTFWAWTPNPRSFDSRYFGVVRTADVGATARLLVPFAPYPWSLRVPEPVDRGR